MQFGTDARPQLPRRGWLGSGALRGLCAGSVPGPKSALPFLEETRVDLGDQVSQVGDDVVHRLVLGGVRDVPNQRSVGVGDVAKEQALHPLDLVFLHVVVEAQEIFGHLASDVLGPDVLLPDPGVVFGEEVEGRVDLLGVRFRVAHRFEPSHAFLVGNPFGLQLCHEFALRLALLGVENRPRMLEDGFDQ